jgi:phage baseplate assembly protein W
MAFGAIQIEPNDTQARVGIGVNLPFSAAGVFTPNYLTSQAVKNNLINYFLTNPGERPGNPEFGGGLRKFIFQQITTGTLEYLQEDIQAKIAIEFPQITLNQVLISENPYNTDSNIISVEISYSINNTGIEDELTLNFN